jgi:hypothetical protein
MLEFVALFVYKRILPTPELQGTQNFTEQAAL